MRTKMKRLLLAVLMLGMPMLQSGMCAGSIKDIDVFLQVRLKLYN